MEKNFVSSLVAQAATETTKTEIASVLVPLGVTKLVEVGAQLSMAGVTTLEGVSYILEVECNDSSFWGGTQQFASPSVLPLTSGVGVVPNLHRDVNIPVQPGAHLLMSVTFNSALTINPSLRVFGKFA